MKGIDLIIRNSK